ncbi:helix-turn-helix transcriptional regulator [Roseofilum sp. BLCC_M154]|uniref:Helix-turn-helix transcriptional regulator n=1 Tax=Roseofilum acuticapitatum BLCC-M154 TaxID=3022444 RepID=A0ABT7AUE6_9CYAN|nr:helix-turn-helix transcriptional regulator [Roseofilum acuticapitatum]MDJ1170520.1 helix-turn-helix transcriptional regulator [Roseofilum acuticapitatum BLCC-M154]
MAANILDTIDRQQLGTSLKQAREQRGMTQADAAQVLEVSRTTLVAIENGTRRLKAAELIKLARAYGRSVSNLVSPHSVVEALEGTFGALYHRSQEEQAVLALRALDRGLITEGKFAQFLGVNRLEARHIAEQLRDSSSRILGDDRVDLREM